MVLRWCRGSAPPSPLPSHPRPPRAQEWGIFWVHYSLHWKPIYWLHKPHHIYNNNLSPFAGLAFHPVDGMCQASPYLLFLFAAPVHFWTHLGMLFFTGIWTTNIHDTITGALTGGWRGG